MNCANFSHAQVEARASFSIWADHLSVSDIVLDANATGFHSLSSFCSSTAPRPKDDASHVCCRVVHSEGFVFDSSSLIRVNASSWAGPQLHALFLRRRSLSGCVSSARFRVNFPNWFAMPRNLLNSGIPVGGSISTMAEVFSGSARIPLASMMCPRNLSDDHAIRIC